MRHEVPFSYLERQFGEAETEAILGDLRDLVKTAAFTLGPPVQEFERRLGEMVGVRHIVATNTGTDALILALKALGVGPGDEVITQPNTFYATVGAIVAVGAAPVFVDVNDELQIDERQIEKAVTDRTKALLPVHWAGLAPNLPEIMEIAGRLGLSVIEDSCLALGGKVDGRPAGSAGHMAAFSLHPLKPVHVWGDGGALVTDDDEAARWLRLYRNHGMINRDEIEIWGVNQRLQSVQAVVANRLLDRVDTWNDRRNELAERIDRGLKETPEISIPPRPENKRSTFQLYIVRAQRRDALLTHLVERGVEAKVHYPIPLHLQKPGRALGYHEGDFPEAEAQAGEIVSLPAHPFLTNEEVDYVVSCVCDFYQG